MRRAMIATVNAVKRQPTSQKGPQAMDSKTANPNRRRMPQLLAAMLLALAATAPTHSVAQDQPAPKPQIAKAYKPVSLEHQYWHLLRWQNHLDKAAAEHEKQGKDGSWLRDHIQKELGFTDAEFAPVRDSAQRLEPKREVARFV
jgi:primosomal protein N''